MNPLAWLNPARWMLYLALAASLLGGYELWAKHERGIGAATVQAKWTAEKLSIAKQSIAIEQATRAKESALIASHETIQKAKNEQIDKLNTDLAGALERLRVRPVRPRAGSVPPVAAVGASCTGASLFAEDASVLIRESGRADKLRLDLIQCQTQYNAAREALK